MKGFTVLASVVVLAVGLVIGSPLPALARDVPAIAIGDPADDRELTCVSCPVDHREMAWRPRHRGAQAPEAPPRVIWDLLRWYSVFRSR